MPPSATADALLRTVPVLFFMGMQISSLSTGMTISKNKNVGSLSPFPFFSMFVNGFTWTVYGTMKADITIFLPNFTSVIVGFFCAYIFHKHSGQHGSLPTIGVTSVVTVPKWMYTVSAAIIIIIAVLGYSGEAYTIGLIGDVMAVCLMGSPLATLQTVIATKSTEALPFYFSLMTFGNALSWSLFGIIIAKDPLVYVPNLLGFVLTVIQLSLFCCYGFGDRSAQKKDVGAAKYIQLSEGAAINKDQLPSYSK